MTDCPTAPIFEISPLALHHRLQQPEAMLLLDVRHADELQRQPTGIRGAVPVILKMGEADLPDVERDLEIVIYDSGHGGALSRQVARWLSDACYRRLWRLEGGLRAWQAANLPVWQIRFGARHRRDLHWTPLRRMEPAPSKRAAGDDTGFLRGVVLPLQREVAVLRIGVIETAATLPREAKLAQTQRLMQCIAAAAAPHRAELHDFEGDGTTLYFAELGAALRAAFDARRGLCAMRVADARAPLARLSLDIAPMTLGYVGPLSPGTRCVIGTCTSTAARILKQAPPGGIIVTARVLHLGRSEAPDLVSRFSRMPNRLHVRSAEQSLPVFLSLPDAAELEPADDIHDPTSRS